MIDLNTRITPKFRNSQNFKNILEFLTTYDTESLRQLQEVNNLDSQYGFVLDEIGKTLGIFPRPLVPLLINGLPSVFTYDVSRYDTVPYADDVLGSFREMSNAEYSKLLRVFAKGINFDGTIQEWEDIIFILTGASCSISNKVSSFGIIVQKYYLLYQKYYPMLH